MNEYIQVKKNEYFDSVTLMSLSAQLERKYSQIQVNVAMATPMNLDIIKQMGFNDFDFTSVSPNDLIIAIKGEVDFEQINEQITSALYGEVKQAKQNQYKNVDEALSSEQFNLAIISVPGKYAFVEAMKLLSKGINVMLFSDNMSIEQEVFLKEYAIKRDLLVMGPDCGTSIINNKGICFANDVAHGNIALISASGTGLQEVSVNIDRLGGGISQAIGVGGRDLSSEVGGMMMIHAMKMLASDEQTQKIVLISKPPVLEVAHKIQEVALEINKPIIICFIDGENIQQNQNITFVTTLLDAAHAAVGVTEEIQLDTEFKVEFKQEQKYLRGLFCGGTLCLEALSYARQVQQIYCNIAKKSKEKLLDLDVSNANTLIDLGDDYFTNGKPHPMIEPVIRLKRLLQEGADPEVKVIIMDFVLGYGSHIDPVGISLDTIKELRQTRLDKGYGEVVIIGYVLGTPTDYQGYEKQRNLLVENDIYVANSNIEMIKLACQLIGGGTHVI